MAKKPIILTLLFLMSLMPAIAWSDVNLAIEANPLTARPGDQINLKTDGDQ